jgi:hypothetical protein
LGDRIKCEVVFDKLNGDLCWLHRLSIGFGMIFGLFSRLANEFPNRELAGDRIQKNRAQKITQN